MTLPFETHSQLITLHCLSLSWNHGLDIDPYRMKIKRLIDALEEEHTDYLKLPGILGIKNSTPRSIMATYLRSGRRQKLPPGGANHVKLDDDMQTRLQEIVDANQGPCYTNTTTNEEGDGGISAPEASCLSFLDFKGT